MHSTSIVSGNGTYQIAGLPSTSPTTDDSQGASLVVIYQDGASSQRGIVIHDGAAIIDRINGPFSYSHDIVSFEPAASAETPTSPISSATARRSSVAVTSSSGGDSVHECRSGFGR